MFKSDKKVILEFRNVCFGYKPKQSVLSDISFSLHENEHIAIIGANACGKSTLGRMIAGLFKPRAGNIYFRRQLINKTNIYKLKKDVGIIFENPDAQFVGVTVQDDIAFGLEGQMVERFLMQPIIDKWAKYTGIFDLLKSSPLDLSGGQKQLAAITSVLAMEPSIIVFDEVTSMLDPQSKQKINTLIKSLKTRYKKSIVTITHDMDEALMADRIIVMNDGKIVDSGTPNHIFGKVTLEYLSLDKPFAFKLSQALGKKPTANLTKLVSEIAHER